MVEVVNRNPAFFDGLDDATAELVFQSYLEDSKQLFEESQARSKRREGVLSDYEIALQLNEKELQRGATILKDRQISKSITRAVLNDAQLLAAARVEDQVAAEDRRAAYQLAGMVPPPLAVQAPPGTAGNPIPINDRDLDVMQALFVRPPSPVGNSADDDVVITGEKLLICVVCQEESRFFEASPVTCAHAYCRDCLQDLFKRSFTDESLFPPKCCGEVIKPTAIRLFLTEEIMIKYEKRKIEMADPNRVYCAVKTCSAYIPKDKIRQDCSMCPECEAFTCALCQSLWHIGDCPTDNGLQMVLANATREGWQRCSACHSMVDLTMGCNHITCRCGHEFCYQCGGTWVPKTCACPTWDENRLLEEAQRRAAQEQAAPGPVVDQARIANARDMIQRQHACDHPRFVYRPGRHICNACGEAHNKFGYKCTACNVSRCVTCRHNR